MATTSLLYLPVRPPHAGRLDLALPLPGPRVIRQSEVHGAELLEHYRAFVAPDLPGTPADHWPPLATDSVQLVLCLAYPTHTVGASALSALESRRQLSL